MRPSSLRSTLSLLAALVPAFAFAQAGALVRGPVLQDVGTDHATVGLRTASACAVDVVLQPASGAAQTVSDAAGTEHFIQVSGLSPATTYHYSVRACGQDTGQGGQLSTAPPQGQGTAHFAAMGDFGVASQQEIDNGNAILQGHADFWTALGDDAYESGLDSEFQTNFFAPLAPLLSSVPTFPVLGNHEYVTAEGQPYVDDFALPTNSADHSERFYSFDWGPVHLVALDSSCALGNQGGPASCRLDAQAQWLAQDLAASKATWKVVYFHHPIYSSGEHGSTAELAPWIPIFQQGGVDLVLNGHDHEYERTFPMKDGAVVAQGTPGAVTYVVVGTGGAAPKAFATAPPAWSAFRTNSSNGYLDLTIQRGTLHAKLMDGHGGQLDAFDLTKPVPPALTVHAEPANGTAPLTVQLAATVDPQSATVDWAFGDGATGSGPSTSHVFATPGTYTVSAQAHDGELSSTVTQTVQVGAAGSAQTGPVPAGSPPASNGPVLSDGAQASTPSPSPSVSSTPDKTPSSSANAPRGGCDMSGGAPLLGLSLFALGWVVRRQGRKAELNGVDDEG